MKLSPHTNRPLYKLLFKYHEDTLSILIFGRSLLISNRNP